MELIERIPLKKLHFLNEMNYKTFKANKCHSDKCKNEGDRLQQYEMMKSYCQGMIKARGEMKRFYSYSASTPLSSEGGGGRLYCGNSVQSLPKKIRGFLLDGITTDIDQKNSSPTILRYICKLNNLDCPELEYYLNHTAELREKYNKMDFINCITDCKMLKNTTGTLRDYDKEIKKLVLQIVDLEQYKVQVTSVPDTKKYNREGSAISRILGYYENEILQVALSVINKKKMELFAPMFDGCLPYGNFYNNQQLLDEITSVVEERFNGLNMVWDFKEHDNSIVMPEDYEIPELKERRANNDLTFCSNEQQARDILYEKLKDSIQYSQEKLYYKHNHLWIDNINIINSILNSYVMDSKIYKTNDKEEILDFVQNRKVATNIAKSIIDKAIENVNNGWIAKAVRSSLGKILFENGYYDFRAEKFYPFGIEGFDNNVAFFEKINYEWGNVDMKKVESIKEKFFYKPFGNDMGDYYILMLARGLAGDAVKRVLFGIGSGNTGKSMMTSAIKSVCGGYYGAFNAMNIAFCKNANIDDDAKRLRWLMLLQTKRIIISNEIKSNTEIDGNMLKKMSNGAKDDIVARCHGGNETPFVISFLPIIFANDLDKINPPDDAVRNRVRGIPHSKVYVEKEEEDCNEFELPMDKNLENEIETLEFKRAFMAVLMQSYMDFQTNDRIEKEPAELKQAINNTIGEMKDVLKCFLDDYEVTNDPTDKVLSSELEEWIKGMHVSMTKLGRELNKYAKLNDKQNVFSKPAKIGGKTKQVWCGVKRIIEE